MNKNILELEFHNDLLWLSDWNGYEVGHFDVAVVGLYQIADTNLYVYIDYEKNKILDGFVEVDI